MRSKALAALAILLVITGVCIVLVPVPFIPTSTYSACMHHVPPNTLYPCDTSLTGYGSVTYDLSGYGGFAGPITHIDQYHVFF